MGSITSSTGTTTWQEAERDHALTCLERAKAFKDNHQFDHALDWLLQALRIYEGLFGGDTSGTSPNDDHIRTLIMIGETYTWLKVYDVSMTYFLRVRQLLRPVVGLVQSKHGNIAEHVVNCTAGIVLVCATLHTKPHKKTIQLLDDGEPLDFAEMELRQAIESVTFLDGSRSNLLISLFHMQSRILVMRGKFVPAQRVMQRCLGLTLAVAQTKRIFHFLSFTRKVLDVIKGMALPDRSALVIQAWWRGVQRKRQAALTESLSATTSRRIGTASRSTRSPVPGRTFESSPPPTGGVTPTAATMTTSQPSSFLKDGLRSEISDTTTAGSSYPPSSGPSSFSRQVEPSANGRPGGGAGGGAGDGSESPGMPPRLDATPPGRTSQPPGIVDDAFSSIGGGGGGGAAAGVAPPLTGRMINLEALDSPRPAGSGSSASPAAIRNPLAAPSA